MTCLFPLLFTHFPENKTKVLEYFVIFLSFWYFIIQNRGLFCYVRWISLVIFTSLWRESTVIGHYQYLMKFFRTQGLVNKGDQKRVVFGSFKQITVF